MARKKTFTREQMLRRLKLRGCSVHFTLFPARFSCVIGSREAFAKYAAWHFEDSSWEQKILAYKPAYGMRAWQEDWVPLIWLPRYPKTPEEYGTLAHEVLHCVHDMADWVGVLLVKGVNEVFCHALDYGVREVLRQLRPRRR